MLKLKNEKEILFIYYIFEMQIFKMDGMICNKSNKKICENRFSRTFNLKIKLKKEKSRVILELLI